MAPRKSASKPAPDEKPGAQPETPDPEAHSALTVILHTVGRRTVLRGTGAERVFLQGPTELTEDEVTEDLMEALEADPCFSFRGPATPD